MTTRTEHPTIETLCAQIDEINRTAMMLIEKLQAERDALRDEVAQLKRQRDEAFVSGVWTQR